MWLNTAYFSRPDKVSSHDSPPIMLLPRPFCCPEIRAQEECLFLQSKYYSEKLGIAKHDAAAHRRVAACFIEGLHWVLEYYYRGVASWTWFYPYHFAPMISDLVHIQDFHVAFQLGQPFLPFQQLLGVLPSASFKLLPEPYQVRHQSLGRASGALPALATAAPLPFTPFAAFPASPSCCV